MSKHSIETGDYFDSENENKLTCIVFIADESAYNNIDYPNFIDFLSKHQEFEDINISYETIVEEIKSNRSTIYLNWVRLIGGERNEFMRDFILELDGLH